MSEKQEYRFNYFFDSEGCLRNYRPLHQLYLSGTLTEGEAGIVNDRIIDFRKCENTWAALTSEMEETPHMK